MPKDFLIPKKSKNPFLQIYITVVSLTLINLRLFKIQVQNIQTNNNTLITRDQPSRPISPSIGQAQLVIIIEE